MSAEKRNIKNTGDKYRDSREMRDNLCYNNADESHINSDVESDKRCEKPNPWWVFLHLLLSPHIGWRKMKRYSYRPDEYARIVFYPMLALMALCRFACKLYHTGISTSVVLQKAVAGFVAFFGGYYLIMLIARTFLPTVARTKIDRKFGHIYVLVVLSSLALSAVIAELLPWLGMMLTVPPIYCMYILAKGVRPLRVPDTERLPVTILMALLCTGVPAGIYYTLVSMMPHV